MKKSGPRGIIATLVTPYDAEEKLDEGLFRKQVRYLLSCGVHGLSMGGTTGEGYAITDDELARMVEISREEAPAGFPIVAGVIRNSTRAAVAAGLVAKEAGATGIMVAPIHHPIIIPDDEGNIAFYETISEKVQLPIVVYNSIAQNEICPGLFRRLLEIKNVIGIKQSLGGLKGVYDMIVTCGDIGLIYAAADDLLYSSFELGADGAIAAILNVFPKECVAIWDAVQSGDTKTGRDLQTKLYPKWQALKGSKFPRLLKEALRQMGMDYGIGLSPLSGATEAEKQEIARVLKL